MHGLGEKSSQRRRKLSEPISLLSFLFSSTVPYPNASVNFVLMGVVYPARRRPRADPRELVSAVGCMEGRVPVALCAPGLPLTVRADYTGMSIH